jgi:hypothetical protein
MYTNKIHKIFIGKNTEYIYICVCYIDIHIVTILSM